MSFVPRGLLFRRTGAARSDDEWNRLSRAGPFPSARPPVVRTRVRRASVRDRISQRRGRSRVPLSADALAIRSASWLTGCALAPFFFSAIRGRDYAPRSPPPSPVTGHECVRRNNDITTDADVVISLRRRDETGRRFISRDYVSR